MFNLIIFKINIYKEEKFTIDLPELNFITVVSLVDFKESVIVGTKRIKNIIKRDQPI